MTTPRYPTVHFEVDPSEVDEASALLWELGASGVEERDATTIDKSKDTQYSVLIVGHFDTEEQAQIVVEALPWEAEIVHIVGDEWRERWREYFQPIRIGERLLITPSWTEAERQDGDIVLTLDPGQAFGTGGHESTRLVLRELESRVRGGERVLDVGCGSGVLSIGALLLGAKEATAIDIELEAAKTSNENAAINGVGDRMKASTTPLSEIEGTFDLVLANIESRVLIPYASLLTSKIGPNGTLIVAGLLETEEQKIRDAYPTLRCDHVGKERDWITMVFTHG